MLLINYAEVIFVTALSYKLREHAAPVKVRIGIEPTPNDTGRCSVTGA
jgi:hypothetical protein